MKLNQAFAATLAIRSIESLLPEESPEVKAAFKAMGITY